MQIRNTTAEPFSRVRDVHRGGEAPVTILDDPRLSSRPRVVIADPQPLVAEAIERLLTPECAIVGRASDGQMLLNIIETRHPDIAVIDVAMPLLNGLDAGRLAKQIDRALRVVIVTANENPDLAAHAVQSFASAYLLKRCPASELLWAIREVMQKRTYVTPLIAQGMAQSPMYTAPAEQLVARLTQRQRQVLQLLAQGKSMKEAGNVLGITARTVAFHKYRMMEQLQIGTSAELIKVAYQGHVI
jgi:DNA-binding NarL/FixJ family response regulator